MSLLELFNTVPDPREAGKVRHSLGSVLFVGLCGAGLLHEKILDKVYLFCPVKQGLRV